MLYDTCYFHRYKRQYSSNLPVRKNTVEYFICEIPDDAFIQLRLGLGQAKRGGKIEAPGNIRFETFFIIQAIYENNMNYNI